MHGRNHLQTPYMIDPRPEIPTTQDFIDLFIQEVQLIHKSQDWLEV